MKAGGRQRTSGSVEGFRMNCRDWLRGREFPGVEGLEK